MSSAAGSIDVSPGAQSQPRSAHDACTDRRAQPSRRCERPKPEQDLSPERDRPDPEQAPVLVAGADAAGRSAMLVELRNLLPESSRFVEACEIWELLARAANSRMVVLTDDLGDVSSASVVKLLGRRHPGLPVLAVGPSAPAGTSHDTDAASV